MDEVESKYEAQEIEVQEYMRHLAGYVQRFNIATDNYKNIQLLAETIDQEKTINQEKIMNESHNLLLSLQVALSNKKMRKAQDELTAKSELFRSQKVSPFSFYSYLKDLALKHLKEDVIASEAKQSQYHHLLNYTDYLTKVNSLDAVKLFNELRDLGYEVKLNIAKTDKQKILVTALRNINFLENFFNLKVSNEELDYYLANRDSHKVGWFKYTIDKLATRHSRESGNLYISNLNIIS